MRPCSITSRSVTPSVFRAVRRLPALRGLACTLACLMALPLCLPFAQAARADAAPAHSALATVLQIQQMEKQAKAHPAPPVPSPVSRLANTPYAAPVRLAPTPGSAGVVPATAGTPPASVTLLDESGHLARTVAPAEAVGWAREMTSAQPTPPRAALLHLWLGEYALAHNEQPYEARVHFRQAQSLAHESARVPAQARSTRRLYGLAAYDAAVARYNQGAYREAADDFARLVSPRSGLSGFPWATAALWLRHAQACAGYHDAHAALGIPEPPRLDPLCGVAALAARLQVLGLPHDKRTLLRACRVTEEGSTLRDLVAAGPRLGVTVRAVAADERGLTRLPLPVVAHVERDHFIAVVRADKSGVSYLCSDCGLWPGGRVDLTWAQWRTMSPGVYAVATRPGSPDDRLMAAATTKASGAGAVRLAYVGALNGLHLSERLILSQGLAALKGHVNGYIDIATYCNLVIFSQHCAPQCCPTDGGGPGNQAGSPGDPGSGGGGPGLRAAAVGASAGDPVNLATGEEEYRPAPDLSVYNPVGPAVVWGRLYNSLRNGESGYEATDFGQGWSHDYNVGVYDPALTASSSSGATSAPGAKYVIESNGARLQFSAPAVPNATSASSPTTTASSRVQCTVQAGVALLVEWDYDPASAAGHFTVTLPDRTRWVTAPGGAYNHWCPLGQVVDRSGNALILNYAASANVNALPLLSSITNAAGTTLLSVARNGSGLVTSVSDCYGRSVYYQPAASPFGGLVGQVSQVAQSGTASAPSRYAYGYQTISATDEPSSAPFLHTITTPSPAGPAPATPSLTPGQAGTSTASINYGLSGALYGFVTGLVDGEGNSRTYTQTPDNTTLVTVRDPQGHVAYEYTASFDNNMSETGRVDGSGNPLSSKTFSDPNDPYRSSSVAGGNASPASAAWYSLLIPQGGAAAVPTTSYLRPANGSSWDILSPSGAVIASSVAPNGWAVPSVTGALFHDTAASVAAPTGAPVGDGYTVRAITGFNYCVTGQFSVVPAGSKPVLVGNSNAKPTALTWDGYGHLLQQTSPRGTVTKYTYAFPPALNPHLTFSDGTPATVDKADAFPMGELVSVQEGSKTPTSYAYYEPSGLIKTLSMPAPGTISGTAVTTSYTWDNLGNLLSMTTPGNSVVSTITTTYNYTADGTYSQSAALNQPLTVTDNLGKITHFRYDSRGNTLSVMDALGNQTDITYNIADQFLQTAHPGSNQQGNGRVTTIKSYLYPGGPITGVTTTDESGTAIRQVNYAYGDEGETLGVSGSTEPVTYTYDALYRLTSLADGRNFATYYFYNTAGYLQQVAYPLASMSTSAPSLPFPPGSKDTITFPGYDKDGNLLRRIDANGVETDYTHSADPQSLLTNIHYIYPQGYTGDTTGDVSLAYDAYGRRAGMTDAVSGILNANGTINTPGVTYAYDDLDDPLSIVTTYTGLAANTVSYRYYPNGSRQSMTTPVSTIAYNYTYDAVGRMTGMTNPYGQSAAWSYLDNGWADHRTLSNAGAPVTVTSHYYDQRGELVGLRNRSASNATLSDYAGPVSGMVYDGAGNRTAWVSNVPAMPLYSRTVNYSYDVKNQVTQEASSGFNYTNGFGYDGAGNITSFKGQSHGYSADNGDNADLYDHNGNPTVHNGQSVSFDPESRMTRFGSVLACGYNGDGQRAWKQNSAGARTYFVYDGSQPVCELNGSGTVAAVTDFGADGVWARHTTTTDWFYTFDPQGGLSQKIGRDGAVLCSSIYDAQGHEATTDTHPDPFSGFGGQWGYYADWETSGDGGGSCLYLLGHRFYDPNTGRFLTRDPIGYDGGINLYAYCGNNPVNGTDPLGTFDFNKLKKCILDNLGDALKEGLKECLTSASTYVGCTVECAPVIILNPADGAACIVACVFKECAKDEAPEIAKVIIACILTNNNCSSALQYEQQR